jgi:copper chaperone CopZ
MLLEGLEDRLDGVFRVEGNYRRAELSIEYDDEKISLAQLSEAIIQLGYTSKVL